MKRRRYTDDSGSAGQALVRFVVALIAAAALFALGLQLGASDYVARWASEGGPPPVSSQEESPGVGEGPAEEPSEPVYDSPGHLGAPPEPRQRYPFIQLSASGEKRKVAHEFEFEDRDYKVTLVIDERMYRGAAAADRMISAPTSESEDERNTAYYRYMVQDPVQAPLITQLSKKLRRLAKDAGLDRDRYAEFVAKYVQSIPYDFAKLSEPNAAARFPVETLVEKTGVCSDKSLLLAAVLAHEGYDVSLLLFEPERHMAVGIKGPGEHYNDTDYLFIETTTPAYLSEVPENYISGIKLTSDPLLIRIGDGDKGYGAAEKVARIVSARDSAKSAQDQLYADASSRPLTVAEANSVNAKLRKTSEASLKLQAVEGEEEQFLDRVPALRWVERNAWWD